MVNPKAAYIGRLLHFIFVKASLKASSCSGDVLM